MNKETANIFLAAWLQENYPSLYQDIALQSGNGTQQHLSGFTDFLSSVGKGLSKSAGTIAKGLSSGVKGVGSFLSSDAGQNLLKTAAETYGAVNAAAIQAQMQRAAVGEAPAIIETTYDPVTGVYTPVLSNDGKRYAIDDASLRSIRPSFLNRYGLWILGGGVLLFLAAAFLRKD